MAYSGSLTVPAVRDSFDRLTKAQAEKQAAVEHRRSLHEQIAALLKQVTLSSEEVEASAERLQEVSKEHNRIACLQFCTKMREKLPREVRDMIYDLIHGPNYYEVVKRRINIRAAGPEQLQFNFRNPRSKNDSKHNQHPSLWWLDDHFSRPIATEIVQRWYQIRTFVFISKHLSVLPEFLEYDVFNKDLEPGTLINRLRCNVAIVRNQDSETKARHLQGLQNLGSIKNKRVELVIRFFCPRRLGDEEKKEGVKVILEVLRPLMKEWREGGFERISVLNSSPKQDLTGLFEGGEEEYQEKLKLFGLDKESEDEESS